MKHFIDTQKISSVLEIAELAIAAEMASIERRFAQSDFAAASAEADEVPSKAALDECKRIEQDWKSQLRAAIYAHARERGAENNRLAGVTEAEQDNRWQTAEILAAHFP